MNRNASRFLATAMIPLALLVAGDRAAGQSPEPPKNSPQEKIRDVLQGHQPAQTGDGVLEDVLGVIQRQGSVLDGSVLDEEPLTENWGQSIPTPQRITQHALVAEQLLRAARMLEGISSDDSSLALVSSMRRQAGKLLGASESLVR